MLLVYCFILFHTVSFRKAFQAQQKTQQCTQQRACLGLAHIGSSIRSSLVRHCTHHNGHSRKWFRAQPIRTWPQGMWFAYIPLHKQQYLACQECRANPHPTPPDLSTHQGLARRTDAANATCQRCLQKGHYTYECKNPPTYVSRPTRTKQLLDPTVCTVGGCIGFACYRTVPVVSTCTHSLASI